MSITGECLCGAIKFEVGRFVGPFELCHCSRCRHAFGAAFASMIGVNGSDFRWITGTESVRKFEAPVRAYPPGYQTAFCSICGSPVPNVPNSPPHDTDWFEIPAGLLGSEFNEEPDRHIYTDYACTWGTMTESIPRLTERELIKMRLKALK